MKYYDTNEFYNQLFNAFESLETTVSDMKDQGDNFVANLVAPGADKQDFKITSQDNKLHVSYVPTKGKNPYCKSFSRSWRFEGVDLGNVSANYVNGILTISVPKSKKPEVEVKTVVVN